MPTKYDPRFCSELMDHMRQGLSYRSFAGIIGVHHSVMYDWEKVHDEWRVAKLIGQDKQRLALELMGLKAMQSDDPFNTTLWIFWMKNCCGWRNDPAEDKGDSKNEEVEAMIAWVKEQIARAKE